MPKSFIIDAMTAYFLIQPHRLQMLLPNLLCQPLRLQDFDVRASGEQWCVEVGGDAQDIFKVCSVLS